MHLSILVLMTNTLSFLYRVCYAFGFLMLTQVWGQTPMQGTYLCIQEDNAAQWRLELAQTTFTFGDLEGDWTLLSEEDLASLGIDASTLTGIGSVLRLDVAGEPRAIGVSTDSSLMLKTVEGLTLSCNASQDAQTTPQHSPETTTPTSTAIANPTPEQLAAQGIDPEQTLIPDAFHCYEDRNSDDYSQYDFDLTILPGNRYSTPFGEGDYEIVDDLPLEVAWLSGPLASENSYAFAGYNDYGQEISLHEIGADEVDFNCYQQGPREEQAKLEWAFKDPQPGSYSCINEDDGSQATLELLENRRYRIDGQEGDYQVNIMGDPDDDLYSVDYLSGPWAEGYGNAYGNEDTGQRTITASTDYGDFDCSMVDAPLQSIKYGTATAAPPPAGAGGLEGFYGNWQIDTLGYCGGLCWDFLYFFPNGYVYTEEPDGLLEDIDCTRTKPNGLPFCDVYTLEGNAIYFSDGERQSFVQTADGLELDGSDYTRIQGADGLQLNGVYRAFSYTQAVGGQGGVALERTVTLRPDGTFTREGFTGASFTTTDTGTQFGDPVAGVTVSSESSNSGTYQFQGNVLIFSFADGQVSKEFFFVIPGEDPANPGAIRIGGSDFLLQE
jgi:hypothetical protein